MDKPNFSGVKILFQQGLPGFEHLREFDISRPLSDSPLYYLQSTEETEICFIVLNPFELTKSYEFDLPNSVEDLLEIKNPTDVVVFNIINVRGGLREATVNLQAPVIINVNACKGMQVVLNDNAFNVREPLQNILQGKAGK
ncbi:MAG: flagellar assembly protein FliW [Bacillota bacterium]